MCTATWDVQTVHHINWRGGSWSVTLSMLDIRSRMPQKTDKSDKWNGDEVVTGQPAGSLNKTPRKRTTCAGVPWVQGGWWEEWIYAFSFRFKKVWKAGLSPGAVMVMGGQGVVAEPQVIYGYPYGHLELSDRVTEQLFSLILEEISWHTHNIRLQNSSLMWHTLDLSKLCVLLYRYIWSPSICTLPIEIEY